MHFPGAEPDLLVHDMFDLEAFGFPGQVIHMPGHTFGSMTVWMEGGELIGGDTVFGLENKQHFPPFAEDLEALVGSWKKLRQLEVLTFYPAHGRPFTRDSFLEEYDAAIKRYSPV
jgi:glyoxylase-like metal-dependent hydrolase (beta-lactamase superfamily II)